MHLENEYCTENVIVLKMTFFLSLRFPIATQHSNNNCNRISYCIVSEHWSITAQYPTYSAEEKYQKEKGFLYEIKKLDIK